MKIQCDVCRKKEASIFCLADEAALCDICDKKVHDANKLASKHIRYSLILPSSSYSPLCDICQEKRALLFCQQDRAILCKECDVPLHTSNEYTQKHNRFLLTGVKLSPIISDYNNNTKKVDDFGKNGVELCAPVPDFKSSQIPTSISPEKSPSLTELSVISNSISSNSTVNSSNNQMINDGLTSNISEYLIDMLPGWHFEDLIVDSASPSSFGFCKSNNNNHDLEVINNEDVLSFLNVENDKEITHSSIQLENENQHNTKKDYQQQETSVSTINFNRKFLKDDTFTVPQIFSSVGSKRIRPYL